MYLGPQSEMNDELGNGEGVDSALAMSPAGVSTCLEDAVDYG